MELGAEFSAHDRTQGCVVGPPATPNPELTSTVLSRRRLHECLNEHLFGNLPGAKRTIEAWRIDYNHALVRIPTMPPTQSEIMAPIIPR